MQSQIKVEALLGLMLLIIKNCHQKTSHTHTQTNKPKLSIKNGKNRHYLEKECMYAYPIKQLDFKALLFKNSVVWSRVICRVLILFVVLYSMLIGPHNLCPYIVFVNACSHHLCVWFYIIDLYIDILWYIWVSKILNWY